MLTQEWKENFRMGKDNFYNFCGELRLFIEKSNEHATSGLGSNAGGLDFVLFVRRMTTQENSNRFLSFSSMCFSNNKKSNETIF